jgi:hypothetical protein
MWTYDSNGATHRDHEMLLCWEQHSDECSVLATLKSAYLSTDYVPLEIQDRWPSPCVDLIVAFNTFIDPLMLKKRKLSEFSPAARKGREKVFAGNAIQHYTHILQLFDKAIGALDRPDTWRVFDSDSDDSSDASDPPFGLPSGAVVEPTPILRKPHCSSLKRTSDDYPDDQPPAKRSNCLSSHSLVAPAPRRSSRSRVRSPS